MNKRLVDKLKKDVMNEKENTLRQALRSMERNDKMIDCIEKLPIHLTLPKESKIWFGFGTVRIKMPRSEQRIKQVRKQLQMLDLSILQGWTWNEHDDTSRNGDYDFRIYYKDEQVIFISIAASMEGSLCALTQIGTKQESYEVPVYEVTCLDGAKELTWE